MKVLSFTVPGRPVGINATYERRSMARGGKGFRLTDEARAYFERVQAEAIRALGPVRRPFTDHILVITQAWFTRDADAGAVGKLVQDALQDIAYGNDRRAVCSIGWKGGCDPDNPRTEVTVRQITAEETAARRLTIDIPVTDSPSEIRRAFREILNPTTRAAINRNRLRPSIHRYGEPRKGG